MKRSVLVSVSLAVLAMGTFTSPVHADSAEAVCEARKDGETTRAVAVADMSRCYEVWGQYGANAQVFICSFNAERQFLSVDLYRP